MIRPVRNPKSATMGKASTPDDWSCRVKSFQLTRPRPNKVRHKPTAVWPIWSMALCHERKLSIPQIPNFSTKVGGRELESQVVDFSARLTRDFRRGGNDSRSSCRTFWKWWWIHAGREESKPSKSSTRSLTLSPLNEILGNGLEIFHSPESVMWTVPWLSTSTMARGGTGWVCDILIAKYLGLIGFSSRKALSRRLNRICWYSQKWKNFP